MKTLSLHHDPAIPHLEYVLENPHVHIRYADHSSHISMAPNSKQLRPPFMEERENSNSRNNEQKRAQYSCTQQYRGHSRPLKNRRKTKEAIFTTFPLRSSPTIHYLMIDINCLNCQKCKHTIIIYKTKIQTDEQPPEVCMAGWGVGFDQKRA